MLFGNDLMSIKFEITLDTNLFSKGEDYCLLLNISIFENGTLIKYKDTITTKSLINTIIFEFNEFINEDTYDVEIQPAEEKFYLNLKPNKITKKMLLRQFRKYNYPENRIREINSFIETYRFTIMFDNTEFGTAYSVKVTKEHLAAFIKELESKFFQQDNE